MKSFRKIMCALLAVIMVLALGACGTPASLQKQWGYKTDSKEYPIGTYIYSLYQAYSYAYQTVYELQGDDFDKEASILDVESSFDETGEVMLCRDWIVKEADFVMKDLITVDALVSQYGIELDEEVVESARQQAYSNWSLGPGYDDSYYSGYGATYTPYKDVLEPLGISFESFFQCTELLDAKWEMIFTYLYGEGGEKEISSEELAKYFEEEFISYSYFTANLFDTDQDETTGNTVNVAYNDNEIKKVKDELELYTKMMAQGIEFKDIAGAYMEYAGLSESNAVTRTESKKAGTLGEEVLEHLLDMKEGTSDYIVVGEGENAVAYFLYRKPIAKETGSYLAEERNLENLMWDFKGEEYTQFIMDMSQNIHCEINTEVTSKYTPELIEEQ